MIEQEPDIDAIIDLVLDLNYDCWEFSGDYNFTKFKYEYNKLIIELIGNKDNRYNLIIDGIFLGSSYSLDSLGFILKRKYEKTVTQKVIEIYNILKQ